MRLAATDDDDESDEEEGEEDERPYPKRACVQHLQLHCLKGYFVMLAATCSRRQAGAGGSCIAAGGSALPTFA